MQWLRSSLSCNTPKIIAWASHVKCWFGVCIGPGLGQVIGLRNGSSKPTQAIEFINENLDNEETVALTAIAALVQLSYSHFSRAFKQSMGVTPNGYMTELRIERAKKLLSETDLPIADIALRTGFASQSHFHYHFSPAGLDDAKKFQGHAVDEVLQLKEAGNKQSRNAYRTQPGCSRRNIRCTSATAGGCVRALR